MEDVNEDVDEAIIDLMRSKGMKGKKGNSEEHTGNRGEYGKGSKGYGDDTDGGKGKGKEGRKGYYQDEEAYKGKGSNDEDYKGHKGKGSNDEDYKGHKGKGSNYEDYKGHKGTKGKGYDDDTKDSRGDKRDVSDSDYGKGKGYGEESSKGSKGKGFYNDDSEGKGYSSHSWGMVSKGYKGYPYDNEDEYKGKGYGHDKGKGKGHFDDENSWNEKGKGKGDNSYKGKGHSRDEDGGKGHEDNKGSKDKGKGYHDKGHKGTKGKGYDDDAMSISSDHSKGSRGEFSGKGHKGNASYNDDDDEGKGKGYGHISKGKGHDDDDMMSVASDYSKGSKGKGHDYEEVQRGLKGKGHHDDDVMSVASNYSKGYRGKGHDYEEVARGLKGRGHHDDDVMSVASDYSKGSKGKGHDEHHAFGIEREADEAPFNRKGIKGKGEGAGKGNNPNEGKGYKGKGDKGKGHEDGGEKGRKGNNNPVFVRRAEPAEENRGKSQGRVFQPSSYDNKNKEVLLRSNPDGDSSLLWLVQLDNVKLSWKEINDNLFKVKSILRMQTGIDRACGLLQEMYHHALQAGEESLHATSCLKAAGIRQFSNYLKAKLISKDAAAADVLCAICKVNKSQITLEEGKAHLERFKEHKRLEEFVENLEKDAASDQKHKLDDYTFLDVDVDSFDDVYDDVAEPDAAVVDREVPSLQWHFNTQFHLLREDFFSPLRAGMNALGKSATSDIWFNKGVTVTGMGTSTMGVVYRICIPKSDGQSFPRNRLKTGSLLCFSDDAFKKHSLLWATVQGNKTTVEETSTSMTFAARFPKHTMEVGTMYDMIESTAFFEAYSHVLRGIQNTELDELPFRDVLLAKPDALTTFNPPASLEDHDEIVFDSLLLPGQPQLLWKNGTDPPELTPDMSTIDEAQYNSIMNALRHEVAIIQGPPGTGKTFVGLKIIQILLDTLWGTDRDKTSISEQREESDRIRWDIDDEHKPPILILCYTNHALDSVLGDLLEGGIEDRIVRIGGSTKVPLIKMHNIIELIYGLPNNIAYKRLKRELWSLSKNVNQSCAELTVERLLDSTETKIPPSAYSYFNRKEAGYRQEHNDIEREVERLEKLLEKLESFSQEASDTRKAVKQLTRELVRLTRCSNNVVEAWLDGDDFKGARNSEENDKGDDDQEDAIQAGRLGQDFTDNLPELTTDAEYSALPAAERYKYFDNWTQGARTAKKEEIKATCRIFEDCSRDKETEEIRLSQRILQTSRIVGATTTGCAKYSKMLEELKPEIVIVEEAAEVLESHILSVLSPHTKHLILIGDHKQLQPKVNNLAMQRKNLCVSMMERLVRSGMQPSMLRTQRRMTKEICSLTSRFYPEEIMTHSSTEDHPKKVKGVSKPLLFLSHHYPETHEAGTSPSNEFEAYFAVELACYLLQQGYDAHQVVILVPYNGQRSKISDIINDHDKSDKLKELKVTCVDNFQGEESDIIILTLVRTQGHGFLKKENRLIVALSRARWGMYVIANMDFIKSVSPEWQSVINYVSKDLNILQSSLVVECEAHGEQTHIYDPREFMQKCPLGGCRKECAVRMDCGHACRKPCHAAVHGHSDCDEVCRRSGEACTPPRSCEHQCKKRCYEDCGPCMIKVRAILKCGHQQEILCSQDPETVQCKTPCMKMLPCRHRCNQYCGEPCTEKCKTYVDKKLKCGHVQQGYCYLDAERIRCKTKCAATLLCDHGCSKLCGECDKGLFTLHSKCMNDCERTLLCGHSCNSTCSKMCPPCKRDCIMACEHSRCGKACGTPCVKCVEKCGWSCEHHKCKKTCWEVCDRPKCDERCKKLLPCGHQCRGYCGDACPTYCDQGDCNVGTFEDIMMVGIEDDTLLVQLACGHIFDGEVFDAYVQSRRNETKIQWLACPTCRRPITPHDTGRYRKEVNQSIIDVNMARKKIVECEQEFNNEKASLIARLREHNTHAAALMLQEEAEMKYLQQRLEQSKMEDLLALRHQVDIFLSTDLREKLPQYGKPGNEAEDVLHYLLTNIVKEEDAVKLVLQVRRLVMAGRLYFVDKSTDNKEEKAMVAAEQSAFEACAKEASDMDAWEERITKIEAEVLGHAATVRNMKMAAKALGMGAGHWFKCSCGHLYIIGECGGAMVESKCPECSSTIGGGNHALNASNTYAGDMLDAHARPAWPTMGQML